MPWHAVIPVHVRVLIAAVLGLLFLVGVALCAIGVVPEVVCAWLGELHPLCGS